MGVCYSGAGQTPPRRCLAVVLVSLITLHGVAVIGECAWLRRWSGVASRSMLRARLTFSAVIATVWAAAPHMLVPLRNAGPAGASRLRRRRPDFLKHPSRPVASGRLAVHQDQHCQRCTDANSDQSITAEHLILVTMFDLTTDGVFASQSRDPTKRGAERTGAEEQGGPTGLLLPSFEQDASNFPWKTDASCATGLSPSGSNLRPPNLAT